MAFGHNAHRAAALLLISASAASARDSGSLQGRVEDAAGAPVSGAVVSVFGGGLSAGGVVALTDPGGRISLPALPAGSYTLRTVGQGRQRALAQRITVRAEERTYFSVSLIDQGGVAPRATDPAGPPYRNEPGTSGAFPTAGVLPVTFGGGDESGGGGGPFVVGSTNERTVPAPGDTTAAEPPVQTQAEGARELRWLLRHKQRSSLESESLAPSTSGRSGPAPSELGVASASLLGATLQIVAQTADSATGETQVPDDLSGLGLLTLSGRLSDSVRWSVGGVMAESQNRTWRMAAEFVIEPGGGHRLEAGSGYGRAPLGPSSTHDRAHVDDNSIGALFVRDRWALTDRFSATAGLHWNYYGFLGDSLHLNPALGAEWKAGKNALLHAGVSVNTLSPGGDLLTLSTLATPPALAYARLDGGLRAEHITRSEIGISTQAGPVNLSAIVFHEGVRDQLLNTFGALEGVRSLSISNGPGLATNGALLQATATFGRNVLGTLSYSTGRTRRDAPLRLADWPANGAATQVLRDGDFHDVVARIETVVRRSDTRFVAYGRISALSAREDSHVVTRTTFDLELVQGLPFLGGLAHADWDLLVGMRNLYYEQGTGAVLDEWAATKAPRRMVGGVSVKF